ncbi:hypothetical protein D3C77_335760 [compost metagenome]
MNDNALSPAKYWQVGRVLENDIDQLFALEPVDDGRVTMALVQGLQPDALSTTVQLHMRENAGQEEIVQHDNAGHRLHQTEHVLMECGVAKVIEHMVVGSPMRLAPLDGAHWNVFIGPGNVNVSLYNYHLYSEVLHQRRQQLRTVITDSTTLGR